MIILIEFYTNVKRQLESFRKLVLKTQNPSGGFKAYVSFRKALRGVFHYSSSIVLIYSVNYLFDMLTLSIILGVSFNILIPDAYGQLWNRDEMSS